tara:strand:- start:435 stop:767 length:333 start_codon:yes stop_codon:yes gene_type:complete
MDNQKIANELLDMAESLTKVTGNSFEELWSPDRPGWKTYERRFENAKDELQSLIMLTKGEDIPHGFSRSIDKVIKNVKQLEKGMKNWIDKNFPIHPNKVDNSDLRDWRNN